MWDTNSTEMPTACSRGAEHKALSHLRKPPTASARLGAEDAVGVPVIVVECSSAGSYRDQVDEGDGVIVDAPQGHDPHRVHSDHDDGQQVEETRAQVQAQQQAAHHKGGQQAESHDEESLGHDGQVLLVEHVCDSGEINTLDTGVRLTTGELAEPGKDTYVYGNTSNCGSVPGICLMPKVMLWASSLAFSSALVNSCELVRGVW